MRTDRVGGRRDRRVVVDSLEAAIQGWIEEEGEWGCGKAGRCARRMVVTIVDGEDRRWATIVDVEDRRWATIWGGADIRSNRGYRPEVGEGLRMVGAGTIRHLVDHRPYRVRRTAMDRFTRRMTRDTGSTPGNIKVHRNLRWGFRGVRRCPRSPPNPSTKPIILPRMPPQSCLRPK